MGPLIFCAPGENIRQVVLNLESSHIYKHAAFVVRHNDEAHVLPAHNWHGRPDMLWGLRSSGFYSKPNRPHRRA